MLGVVVCGLLTADEILANHFLDRDGVVVSATVSEVHSKRHAPDTARVTFRTRENREVTITLGSVGGGVEVGDEITVVYDPSRPAGNVVQAGRESDLFLWLGLGMLSCAVYGAINVRRAITHPDGWRGPVGPPDERPQWITRTP
ncbi:DUF3592 domain-containing protein [Streptosporangium sp. NPDC002524]|uniref:DUF3592 domain-containing protein n=1 Tax=Streptosporangium sp. NPDC002524 TaxID=3154537 RepID=UPI00332F0498